MGLLYGLFRGILGVEAIAHMVRTHFFFFFGFRV